MPTKDRSLLMRVERLYKTLKSISQEIESTKLKEVVDSELMEEIYELQSLVETLIDYLEMYTEDEVRTIVTKMEEAYKSILQKLRREL